MTQRDLLCCELAGVHFAVPLERVIGVAEGGVVTPLPYTAPAFEGLVEVFGQVMPQANLALLLGLEAATGGILVVVSDRGGSIAFRVAVVTRMIRADEDRLTATAPRVRALHPLYMAEVEHQGIPHYVLDLDALATSDELELSAPDGGVLIPEARPTRPAEPEQEWVPLLLLEIAGERYAVPNLSIVELHVPDGVRSMPGAPQLDARRNRRPRHADHRRVDRGAAGALGARRTAARAVPDRRAGTRVPGRAVRRPRDRARARAPQPHPPDAARDVRHRQLLRDSRGRDRRDHRTQAAPVTGRPGAAHRDPAATERGSADLAGGDLRALPAAAVGSRRARAAVMTLERIERIVASVQLTPLPRDIAYFDGLADVGDAVVPVINLRRQQGEALQPFDGLGAPPCILAMLEGATTGILVDQVLSIIDIPAERFEPVAKAARLPISHVLTFEGRLMSLLINRLLPRGQRPERDMTEPALLQLFRLDVAMCGSRIEDNLVALTGDAEVSRLGKLAEVASDARTIAGGARLLGLEPAVRLALTISDAAGAGARGTSPLRPDAVNALSAATALLARIAAASPHLVGWMVQHAAEVAAAVSAIATACGIPTRLAEPPRPARARPALRAADAAACEPGPSAAHDALPKFPAQRTRRGISVLLVDDQPMIAEAIRQLLRGEAGLVIHHCADPRHALAMAAEVKPTVILQDLVMPDVDGLTLIRYFRAYPATTDVPIIALSTLQEPALKAAAFQSGANDYVVKLPDRLELVARIRYLSKGYLHLLDSQEAWAAVLASQEQLEIRNRFIR